MCGIKKMIFLVLLHQFEYLEVLIVRNRRFFQHMKQNLILLFVGKMKSPN